jgi:hypothetical protein
MKTTEIWYQRLQDGKTWGVRGYGLTEGESVTVTKANGTTKIETIVEVISRSPEGVCVATIASTTPRVFSEPVIVGGGARSSALRDGRYWCPDCRINVHTGTRCSETGGLHSMDAD